MEEKVRNEEFPQLKGVTYLDHAGATLYSKSQLEAHVTDLIANLYGNPHTQSPSSQTSSAAVDHARDSVLRFFGTESSRYDVVFTSGCTAALKLLSECFPWQRPPTPNNSTHTNTRESVNNTHSEEAMKYSLHSETSSSSVTSEKTMLEFQDCSVSVSSKGAANGSVGREGGTVMEPSVSVLYTRDFRSHESVHCEQLCSGEGGRRGGGGGGSVFCYLEDNHTSVIGMREVAAQFGASIVCATAEDIVTCPASGNGANRNESGTAQFESGTAQTESGAPHARSDLTTSNGTMDEQIESSTTSQSSGKEEIFNLFVYPAQSNFCGRKYPLEWCTLLPTGRISISGLAPPLFPQATPTSWKVCLDAASFVGTNPLNLTDYPADFVTVSFYKMFGFPTGLGALLVRRDNAGMLRKRYFGGGTVFGTVSRAGLHLPRSELHERLEDGTIPFLGIRALVYGFETLSRLAGPMTLVTSHTFTLAKYAYDNLTVMTHSNGAPVSVIYCSGDFSDLSRQGAIVNFNLLRPNGEFVGFSEVSNLASVHDIHLRTGCFCNTGACMAYLNLDTAHILSHMQAGHVCGDDIDLINGKPTGSVRISFGYMSTLEDAKTFISFIEKNFRVKSNSDDVVLNVGDVEGRNSGDVAAGRCGDVMVRSVMGGEVRGEKREGGERWIAVGDDVTALTSSGSKSAKIKLDSIRLYPIKSCAALKVSEWLIGGCGLRYDREWVVLSEHRACLSQKQEPRLSLILPYLVPHSQELELKYPGKPSLKVPIESVLGERVVSGGESTVTTGALCQMRVCGDRVAGTDCGEAAASWLSAALSRDCRLVRQAQQRTAKELPPTTSATGTSGDAPLLSLANEAQYLLVTLASAGDLLSEISKRHSKQVMSLDDLVSRFRPNLVVSGNGMAPYEEDNWTEVTIGSQKFKVVGRCSRCRTVCVDQGSGERTSEPLQTLLQLRGSRATFGVYLTVQAFPAQ